MNSAKKPKNKITL